jgi:ferredoxin-type protein NapH
MPEICGERGRMHAKAGARAPAWKSLATPGVFLLFFWTLAILLWRLTGAPFWILNFGWIGTSIAVGWGLFAVLPRPKRVWGRRLAQALVGTYMLGFLGLYLGENMQVEGFLFLLLAGVWSGAVLHYLVAKVFGPLLFGRGWCGWACWTAAVLDLLPFDRPSGREALRWGWGRHVSFAASLSLVAVLWAVGYRAGGRGGTALHWLLAGNALYYGAAVGLAFALHDNRAFCKYLCPIPVPMKLVAPLAVMKIGGDGSRCTACHSCERACPMDVKVGSYLRAGKRVLTTECILCQLCVNTCPRGIPRVTLGFDRGRSDQLRFRSPAKGASRARGARLS